MTHDRVLMISGNGPDHACGVAHFTERLLGQLSADNGDPRFVWLSRRARLRQSPVSIQGPRVTQLRPWHTWRPAAARLAAAVMRTWRPHIVHIQDEVHSFHETRAAIDMAKSAIQIGAKVVVTLHEYHTQLPSVRFTDELVSLADAVIVQDARNGQRCQDRTGRVPAAIGWSPANIDPPPHDVSPVPNRLVTFGLISPGKGFELVYEALKKVRPSHPELSWHIMGPFDPTRNEYHRELKQRLTEPWVTFTGGGTKEMAEIGFRTALASASVMLLPFSDGCSPRRTTLQAAWAFGLPTVTTSPEVPEPGIRSGDNCVLVPGIGASESEQIDAWASAIGSVLSRAELRDVLRRGSLAAAGAHSWSELRSQHEAIYSQVLSSRISKRVSLEH